ncbi:MAG: hypothetical protein RR323_06795, partial [Raoultibacter sp.]
MGIGQNHAIAGDDKARAFATHGRIRLLRTWTQAARAGAAGHTKLAEEFEEGIIGADALTLLLALAGLVALFLTHGARRPDHA